MASIIGRYAYYVHYHAVNAVSKAPIRQKNYFSEYALQKLSSPKIIKNSGISKQTKKSLEEMIEGIHDPIKLKADIDRDQVWTDIKALLEKRWNGIWDTAILEETTGRVLQTGGSNLYKQHFNSTYIQTRQISQYIADLQDIIQRIGSATQLNVNEKKLLAEKCNEVIDEINNITQKGIAQLENNQKGKGHLVDEKGNEVIKYGALNLKQGVEYVKLSKDTVKKIQKINELLAKLPTLFSGMTAATGLSEEALTVEASMLLAGIAVSSTSDFLYSGLKNSRNTKGNFASGAPALIGEFSPNIEWKINGIPAETWSKVWKGRKAYTKQLGQGVTALIDVNSSQQKIDALLTLPTEDPSYDYGIKAVPASIKNRNFNAAVLEGIGLVSKTNVWYLMQNESTSFLRRYLNVLADRNEENISDEEMIAIQKLKNFRDDAKLATSLISAYKALSGDTFQRTRAELFVVYDSGSKKSYVLDIGDLMKALVIKISNNPKNIKNYFTDTVISTLAKPLKNEYMASIHERMADLLTDIKERELSVALSISGFKDLSSFVKSDL